MRPKHVAAIGLAEIKVACLRIASLLPAKTRSLLSFYSSPDTKTPITYRRARRVVHVASQGRKV